MKHTNSAADAFVCWNFELHCKAAGQYTDSQTYEKKFLYLPDNSELP